MANTVVITEKKDSVGYIYMNSPKKFNALDRTMLVEIMEALDLFEKDDEVNVIVITGIGKAFCAGGDVSFFFKNIGNPDEESIQEIFRLVGELVIKMKKLPKIIIGAVNGVAAGGGANLALACDIVIAAENVNFIQAFVNIGLTPDTGGAFFLPRLVGTHTAFEVMASGRTVSAAEALSVGMINEICAPDELVSKTIKTARKYASGPLKSYAALKELMYESIYRGLEKFLLSEYRLQCELARTSDYREGITAFVEKRKPNFAGK